MELGVIQGIKIFMEDSDKEKRIWFYQKLVRNIEFKKIQQKNFEISEFLVKAGYEIPDRNKFDQEFMAFFMTHRLLM